MIQSDFLQPSWPFCDIIHQERNPCSDPNAYDVVSALSVHTNLQDSVTFPGQMNGFMDKFVMDLEPWDDVPELFDVLEGMQTETLMSRDQGSSNSTSIVYAPVELQSLIFPREGMEMDTQLAIGHLLKAYGEAMTNGNRDLADVISKRLADRSNLLGCPLERIAFHLSCESREQDGGYIKHDSSKNFWEALTVFYQAFPYGRFAHHVANSAILEAIPIDVEVVHVVDFDLGAGLQWPPLIEALARRQRPLKLKLTHTMMEDDDAKFDAISEHLRNYAAFVGVNLTLEAEKLEDLVIEFTEESRRKGEWMAFNCMVGAPQMGRVGSRKAVLGFLEAAKGILALTGKRRGIVTLGDGDACWKLKDSPCFGTFFEGQLEHYQALLESMQSSFPSHLQEARLAMESLFVAPYISTRDWFRSWENLRTGLDALIAGLSPKRIEQGSIIMEIQEMLRTDTSGYGVRRSGHCENDVILDWRGTPLIRISTWEYQDQLELEIHQNPCVQ